MIRLAALVLLLAPFAAHAQTTPPPSTTAPARARLVVIVSELRNDHGSIRCTLFSSASGFPSDPTRAVARASATPRGGRGECVFDDLAPGTYAVAVHHDEDGEGDFDTGIFGIPTEGVGASRDARGSMGPPSFDDARIELHAGENRTRVHVTYP
jgi:uncharacterized protein (DUF2141 family)